MNEHFIQIMEVAPTIWRESLYLLTPALTLGDRVMDTYREGHVMAAEHQRTLRSATFGTQEGTGRLVPVTNRTKK